MKSRLKERIKRLTDRLRSRDDEPYFPPDYDDQQSIAEGLWFVARIAFIGSALWIVWRYLNV